MRDGEARRELAQIRERLQRLEITTSHLKESVRTIGTELGLKNISSAPHEVLLFSSGDHLRLQLAVKKLGMDLNAILDQLEVELVIEPSKVVVYEKESEEEEEEEDDDEGDSNDTPTA